MLDAAAQANLFDQMVMSIVNTGSIGNVLGTLERIETTEANDTECLQFVVANTSLAMDVATVMRKFAYEMSRLLFSDKRNTSQPN